MSAPCQCCGHVNGQCPGCGRFHVPSTGRSTCEACGHGLEVELSGGPLDGQVADMGGGSRLRVGWTGTGGTLAWHLYVPPNPPRFAYAGRPVWVHAGPDPE